MLLTPDVVAKQSEAQLAKIQEMLVALEAGATTVIGAAREASAEAGEDKYKAYLRFREVVDDFDTLAIVIEYKLKRLKGEKAASLTVKFDELTVSGVAVTRLTREAASARAAARRCD